MKGHNNKCMWTIDIERHLTNTQQHIRAAFLRWTKAKTFIIKATALVNYSLAACVLDFPRDKNLAMGRVGQAHYSKENILSIIHAFHTFVQTKEHSSPG